MRGADGRIVVIPMHRVLKRGTLRNLIRQAGISLQAFIEAL
jgi:predicted RNA binding protein YcfA (HicA-like mRNA interferase family)